MITLQELWCKKMPPSAKLFKVWKPLQKAALDQASDSPRKLQPDRIRTLIRTADDIGKLLQYRQQGFLPNMRQQRMAGLAVVELAQAVRELVRFHLHECLSALVMQVLFAITLSTIMRIWPFWMACVQCSPALFH